MAKYRGRIAGVGLIVAGAGWGMTSAGRTGGWGLVVAAWGLVAAGTVTVLMVASSVWRGFWGTTGQIRRWNRRTRRTGGVQSLWQHFRITSSWAMRRQATTIRPSLAGLSMWRRLRTPVMTYAARLGHNGRRTLWISAENVVLRVAGARAGKSSAMADRIVDAPGAVVVTSTRVDLLLATAPVRAQRGPLLIFNPANIGKYASTLKWSPLAGCRDIETAQRRANDLIPESTVAERENWNLQARRALAPLLYAAARSNGNMQKVLRWVAAAGEELKNTAEEVAAILADAPESLSVRHSVRQFFGTNDRTRTSIVTTIMPALAWLANPKAAAIGDSPEEDQLDVDDMLDSCATVYLLGAPDGTTGPLTGALVAEIAYRSAYRAECQGGRLDPSLLLALDECALVAPGPVDRWTSDMGGRGIVLDIAVQSLAWLERVWGEVGRRIIVGNTAVVLVGAGCKDPADLDHWEALSGWREVERVTKDADGNVSSTTVERVPVITRDQIANLPKHRAVVYGAGPVCIIRTPRAYRRRDVRRALARNPYRTTAETNYAADPSSPEPESTA